MYYAYPKKFIFHKYDPSPGNILDVLVALE